MQNIENNIVILKPTNLLESHEKMVESFLANFESLEPKQKRNFKITVKSGGELPVVKCFWAVMENGKYIDESEVFIPPFASNPLELIKQIDKSRGRDEKQAQILAEADEIFDKSDFA